MVDLSIIFIAALASSVFGTLIGGSSLITIPTLVLLGLPPHAAIGTDRLGITGISIAGWYQFHKRGMIHYRVGFVIGIAALCGSFIGSCLGVHYSDRIGNIWIKRLFILLVLVMIVKLLTQR